MAGLLDLVGLVGLVVSLLALVRGRLGWARLTSRPAAALALIASLGAMVLGASLAPASSTTATAITATTLPTPTAEPVETAGPESEATDPDAAEPTSTTAVSTVGLKPVPPVTPGACRAGNPLANVYHPDRLQVVRACATAAGVVRSVRREDDGDVHFDVALDPGYAGMLTPGNSRYQHGWLVVELVPADEPGCTVGQPPRPASGSYDYGRCTGARQSAPVVGMHVFVTGPYVLDHVHDWAEIHPAWLISATRPAAPQPAFTAAAVPRPATAPAGQAVACSATMSNPTPAPYSTTDVVVHTGAARATVTATAHYKSTDTSHSGESAANGVADLPFRLSRATKGYRVQVDVTVSLAGRSASCSTAFTPQ